MNSATRLAFLGGGNMAWAFVQGLLRHGVAASQLCVGEPSEGQRARLQAELGVRALAEEVCAAVGITVWVRRESDLDIVTAHSGSGSAYFIHLTKHLAAAAAALGLDAQTASILAAQALWGAGAMLEGTVTPGTQREAVTSPGGTTAAALGTLAAGGFDKLAAATIAAAAARGAELAAASGRSARPDRSE